MTREVEWAHLIALQFGRERTRTLTGLLHGFATIDFGHALVANWREVGAPSRDRGRGILRVGWFERALRLLLSIIGTLGIMYWTTDAFRLTPGMSEAYRDGIDTW
jgi:hypothetical protein